MQRSFLIVGKWFFVVALLAASNLPAVAQGPVVRPDYRSRGYQPRVEPQPEPARQPSPWTVDSPNYEWQSPYYQGKNDYGPGVHWRSGQPSAEDDWEYRGQWRRRRDRAHAPVYSGAFISTTAMRGRTPIKSGPWKCSSARTGPIRTAAFCWACCT